MTLSQRNRVPVANDDCMRTYPEWFNIQRGLAPSWINVRDTTIRYLRNGRDLVEYVHRMTQVAQYPLHEDVLNAKTLEAIFRDGFVSLTDNKYGDY